MDITGTISNQLKGKPRFMKSDLSSTTKGKLARKRQKETLKFIQENVKRENVQPSTSTS